MPQRATRNKVGSEKSCSCGLVTTTLALTHIAGGCCGRSVACLPTIAAWPGSPPGSWNRWAGAYERGGRTRSNPSRIAHHCPSSIRPRNAAACSQSPRHQQRSHRHHPRRGFPPAMSIFFLPTPLLTHTIPVNSSQHAASEQTYDLLGDPGCSSGSPGGSVGGSWFRKPRLTGRMLGRSLAVGDHPSRRVLTPARNRSNLLSAN